MMKAIKKYKARQTQAVLNEILFRKDKTKYYQVSVDGKQDN